MTTGVAGIDERLNTFFKLAFDETGHEGYVCIASRNIGDKASFAERFFHWPSEASQISEYCYLNAATRDLWYCPQLFSDRRRIKDNVISTPTAWSDLDTCKPENLLIEPTVTIESSPGRYQALWRFRDETPPIDAEDVSRRIAYHHAYQGADKSGWDLTQLLRVPYTQNHKYDDLPETPQVKILKVVPKSYNLKDFDGYEQVPEFAYTEIPFPEEIPEFNEVRAKYKHKTSGALFELIFEEPARKEDWSKALWTLEKMCLEAGMTMEETFSIASNAACNKYKRDNRPEQYLWREVCRAWEGVAQDEYAIAPSVIFDLDRPLLSEEEREECRNNPSFVERYIKWARSLGDASWQYHQAGAFIILSSLLAASVKLDTSFGSVKPNLWFMILADTTLTRKTTAMDIATDLLADIDDNAVLATDGSIEGLLAALAQRPNRSSLFLRDEFTGLVESMTKRDYLAGMMESFTKLYDGKAQKRILRRETIDVRDPVLLLFAGGIKNRMLQLLSYDHVMSGFLPRFVFITAEVDITKIKPVGPPTVQTTEEREELVAYLSQLREHYTESVDIVVDGKKTTTTKKIFKATMTDDAWERYNRLEMGMVNAALNSMHQDVLMPMMDRLAKSGLRAAILIAATRMEGDVVITEQDIVRAFYYVEQWRTYAVEVIANVGRTDYEKILEQIMDLVERQSGIYRGDIMRKFHLQAKQTDEVLNTLEQRRMIMRKKSGKSEQIYPMGSA